MPGLREGKGHLCQERVIGPESKEILGGPWGGAKRNQGQRAGSLAVGAQGGMDIRANGNVVTRLMS